MSIRPVRNRTGSSVCLDRTRIPRSARTKIPYETHEARGTDRPTRNRPSRRNPLYRQNQGTISNAREIKPLKIGCRNILEERPIIPRITNVFDKSTDLHEDRIRIVRSREKGIPRKFHGIEVVEDLIGIMILENDRHHRTVAKDLPRLLVKNPIRYDCIDSRHDRFICRIEKKHSKRF